MDRNVLRVLIQALPLVIPLNVYMIGDWLATGLQWALFRFQQPFLNEGAAPFFINALRELGYVTSGLISGRSAAAIVVWYSGTALLIAALALVLYRPAPDPAFPCRKYAPHATIAAGCLFLVSCMLQYGIVFSGPSGFSIPAGVPAILVLGYWTYRLDADGIAAGPEVSGDEED